ncbi:MAG TPA: hypothetical protein VIJ33_01920, partial [Solirubrobacteraceae bacterium]
MEPSAHPVCVAVHVVVSNGGWVGLVGLVCPILLVLKSFWPDFRRGLRTIRGWLRRTCVRKNEEVSSVYAASRSCRR